MNRGIYGFPSTQGIAASNIISITEFDVTGTYSIPPNAATLEILLVGAGGGGGGGAGANGANSSGGGGGGGGSIVYINCLVVEDLPSMTLNVTVGTGGLGGGSGLNSAARAATNGGPGGNTLISMTGFPGLFLRAQGGVGGAAVANGTVPSAAGSAAGGAGKISSLQYVQVTNSSGQNGGISTVPMPSIVIFDSRNNGGGGGGSSPAAGVATTGGSIEISTNLTATNAPILYHINLPLVGITLGITAAYGGAINSGPVAGAGQNGKYMIGNTLKSYGGGIGGAGGGASVSTTVTLGGGNGGNGYRGGGGGGGGSSRVSTVPGGTGGYGGNGYCCIIARA